MGHLKNSNFDITRGYYNQNPKAITFAAKKAVLLQSRKWIQPRCRAIVMDLLMSLSKVPGRGFWDPRLKSLPKNIKFSIHITISTIMYNHYIYIQICIYVKYIGQ
jgi:hypothetical protein